ncbi:MAG: hypothetical protein J1E81_02220 [Eubacterium sp.]|nr:hypothetical protein [Eubacterium sp.]
MGEYDFIKNGKKELEAFYGQYFDSMEELQNFLLDAFDYESGSLSRRQALFQVQRFVSLANDIDRIRPARDSLRVLFLKFGLDSLCSLSKLKKADFYKKFCDCFSSEGTTYILNNFKLSYFEDEYKGHSFEASHNIDLSDFLNIIKTTRDMVAHDFNYWEMQFFAYDEDSIWLTSIETKEDILLSYHYQRENKKATTYHFQTTLRYEKFIHYFTEACVNFIKLYFVKSK